MIGILSDAHGNQPAFARAVSILRDCGADRFLFLGDALGYLASTAVLASIRELGNSIRCIRGNHEDMLLHGVVDQKRDEVYRHSTIRSMMSSADWDMIAAWPPSLRVDTEAGAALFVHGSPSDNTNGYVYPDSDLDAFAVAEHFVFMGHTHRPFVRTLGHTIFVNVGSCGLPRDHGALGSAGLLDDRTGKVRLVRFPITDETRQALEAASGAHESVLALASRRPQTYEGELIGH